MPTTAANPDTQLRRVVKRLSELREQETELVRQLGLDTVSEKVVLDALGLTAEVETFLDRTVEWTITNRRKAVALSKRLARTSLRVDALPDSAAREAAVDGVRHAVQRLLHEAFTDT